jgi:hypothetical protein
MRTNERRHARAARLAASVLALATVSSAEAASRPHALNRSLYLPVSFQLCPHLAKATLHLDGQLVAVLPGERLFQFTYYPELKRLEPGTIQLEVEGDFVAGGDPFRTRMLLTADGILVGSRQIPISWAKEMQSLRYKIDARHPTVSLRIRCNDLCVGETTVASSGGNGAREP